jgi:hypothetical protein
MTFRKGLTKIVGWVVATVVPLIAAIITQRRSITVIASFAEWALARHARALLTLAIVLAIVAVLRQLMARFVVDFLPIPFLLQRLSVHFRIALAAALLGAFVIILKYVMIQYRVFSEVSYPDAAMKAWRKKDVLSARETCEQYVALYPQRGASAAVPDTVCTPILESTVMLINLRTYVARQHNQASRHVDGIALGAVPELQQEFLAVLDGETDGIKSELQPAIQRANVLLPRTLLAPQRKRLNP